MMIIFNQYQIKNVHIIIEVMDLLVLFYNHH